MPVAGGRRRRCRARAGRRRGVRPGRARVVARRRGRRRTHPVGRDTDANTQVVIGWRDELRRAGKTVGVYSTRGYWRQVVGHWQADLPQWPAVGLAGVDTARRACARPFTSGPVLLTQWLTGPARRQPALPGPRPAGRVRSSGTSPGPAPPAVPALLVTWVPHPDIEAAQRAQAALEASRPSGPGGQGQAARRQRRGRGHHRPGSRQPPSTTGLPGRQRPVTRLTRSSPAPTDTCAPPTTPPAVQPAARPRADHSSRVATRRGAPATYGVFPSLDAAGQRSATGT